MLRVLPQDLPACAHRQHTTVDPSFVKAPAAKLRMFLDSMAIALRFIHCARNERNEERQTALRFCVMRVYESGP